MTKEFYLLNNLTFLNTQIKLHFYYSVDFKILFYVYVCSGVHKFMYMYHMCPGAPESSGRDGSALDH